MLKAIIFDMDGVLFESHDAWVKVFNKSREHFGLKPISVEEFDKNCWSVDSSIVVPRYFQGKSTKDVTSYYDKIFLEFIDDVILTKKAKETLEGLKKRKIRLAIATNTYHKQAERILKVMGLRKYFEVIVGADDVRIGKPEPDIIYKAVKELGLKISEIVFIGDNKIDMQTCENARCSTIGYKIDGHKRIDNFEDLLKVV